MAVLIVERNVDRNPKVGRLHLPRREALLSISLVSQRLRLPVPIKMEGGPCDDEEEQFLERLGVMYALPLNFFLKKMCPDERRLLVLLQPKPL